MYYNQNHAFNFPWKNCEKRTKSIIRLWGGGRGGGGEKLPTWLES